MLISTKALSRETLEKNVLKEDKKKCRRFGPCGVGQKALYLNSFYLDRVYYVPFFAVKRVFKRVAMSKGGFTGKGMSFPMRSSRESWAIRMSVPT